jgi:hypothetical protein
MGVATSPQPKQTNGSTRNPKEWIVSVKYRVGCPVFPTSGKCPACPKFSGKEGDHAISCGYQWPHHTHKTSPAQVRNIHSLTYEGNISYQVYHGTKPTCVLLQAKLGNPHLLNLQHPHHLNIHLTSGGLPET